eukprot:6213621-Pleurochrysis_carterae.AAC.2
MQPDLFPSLGREHALPYRGELEALRLSQRGLSGGKEACTLLKVELWGDSKSRAKCPHCCGHAPARPVMRSSANWSRLAGRGGGGNAGVYQRLVR